MKTWTKLVIVCVGGALAWGLAYSSSVWTQYAMVFASISTASTAAVGLLVGWTPKE
jgi:hypothetical protein